MIETLDYSKLVRACSRALRRHQLSELEMVIAHEVLDLSFGIEEPFLRLNHAVELSRLTGLSKGKAHEVVKRLVRGRALEVSDDGCIYTFLPPSRAWPWLFAERVEPQSADELERAIVWAAKSEQQDHFGFHRPEAGQEFAEALAIERMRKGLLEYHHAATARFADGSTFPVMDRSPKSAPALGLSSGEGQSRPLETTGRGDNSSVESFTIQPEETSEMPVPRLLPDDHQNGSRIGNRVPESGTALLRDFKGSKGAIALNPLKPFKAAFPNREPLPALDPGAGEEEIMAWLKLALGAATMEQFGGWWRLRVRESRWAALNLCMELRLRLTDRHLKPLRNPGGWARDQYSKLRKEEAEAS